MESTLPNPSSASVRRTSSSSLDQLLSITERIRQESVTKNPSTNERKQRNSGGKEPPSFATVEGGPLNSHPPSRSVSGPASVLRTPNSRLDIQSMADEMLKASLTREPSKSKEYIYDPAPLPPSYRTTPASVTSMTLSRTRDRAKPSRPGVVGAAHSSSAELSSRLSAAEQKDRIRRVEQEVMNAAAKVKRSTEGVFKQASSTDLLFLMDTTNSMKPYIDEAKSQVKNIVHDIHEAFLREAKIRVAVVTYTDHNNDPSVGFLDFTPDVEKVYEFLDTIKTKWGKDYAENVLGGLHQALSASWAQPTRCLIHIGDSPPHGKNLHTLSKNSDDYYEPGSEPHGLTYEPLLKDLVNLKVNYAFMSITNYTDKMASVFSRTYSDTGMVRLLPSNKYHGEKSTADNNYGGLKIGPRFVECKLGTSFAQLRQLVVSSVTASISSSASRIVLSNSSRSSGGWYGSFEKGSFSTIKGTGTLSAIKSFSSIIKDGASVSKGSYYNSKTSKDSTGTIDRTLTASSGKTIEKIELEAAQPRWSSPGWLSELLDLEGFCPDVVVHNASTLNEMIESDDNIKLSVAQLTVRARPKPFSHGAIRTATYARPMHTTSPFVIKSFINEDGGRAEMIEDMRCQALCKAFALEFNGLVEGSTIDFVVTMCLRAKNGQSNDRPLSIEPFIEGKYVKYNSNAGYVLEDDDNPFNDTAQAFSHFTFERSWGHFMVVDLQGVGSLLTDPSVHTKDPDRFKLPKTNLGVDGFKLFFATHQCNHVCRLLELRSSRDMAATGIYEFRESWPAKDPTVCCANKLCRRIIRRAGARSSPKYAGHHWCASCWPQLKLTARMCICVEPGTNHEFEVSRFYYESQAQEAPKKCPDHMEKDRTVSSAAVVGAGLWNKMKSSNQNPGASISGRAW